MRQVIAITGASSRIGEAASHELAKAGHIVYAFVSGSVRHKNSRIKAIRRFAVRHRVDFHAIELEGNSDSSTRSAIGRIVSECGRLDALIHIVGPDAFGFAGACTSNQRAQFCEAYVLGTQRVNRAALPVFCNQSCGLVMWVVGSQTQEKARDHPGPYLAAKAALDALAASDASELARWNVQSTILITGATDNTGAIVSLIEMPAGTRPLVVHPENNQPGTETVRDRAGETCAGGFRMMRLSDRLRSSARRVIDMYS